MADQPIQDDDDVVEAWQVCRCCDNVTGEHQHDDATCEHPCCPGWGAELNDGQDS